MRRDPIPYANEEPRKPNPSFTQSGYERNIARLYAEFERSAPRKNRLLAATDSALFHMSIGWQHVRAVVNHLTPRHDLKYDAQRGYHFEPLQLEEHPFTDRTGEGRGFAATIQDGCGD